MAVARRKFTFEFKTEASHRVVDSDRTVREVPRLLSSWSAPFAPGSATSGAGSRHWPTDWLLLRPRRYRELVVELRARELLSPRLRHHGRSPSGVEGYMAVYNETRR
jgi:hypothetical protein